MFLADLDQSKEILMPNRRVRGVGRGLVSV
jgi:hypothetical protein